MTGVSKTGREHALALEVALTIAEAYRRWPPQARSEDQSALPVLADALAAEKATREQAEQRERDVRCELSEANKALRYYRAEVPRLAALATDTPVACLEHQDKPSE